MGIRPQQIAEAGEVQRMAAVDGTTRVRVVAGPGTGKSFTIEQRVCWLLEQGVDINAIAAVSFTRASALDLQSRVHAACVAAGHDGSEIRVTTLHSLALRSLRKRGALGGYPVDPVVLDRWELENLFDDEFGHLAGIGITRRREIREDHEAFWSTGSHDPRPSQDPPEPPISEEERTRFTNFHGPRTQLYACVLPGELVQRCVAMMDAGTLEPASLLGIEQLIVDEFQDLNPMDLRFVYGIEAQGVGLFVAGDDDQSLYSFRYAMPTGIQKFTERFDPVGDHVLRDCFRCTPKVLSSAEKLISANAAPGRIPKNHVSLYAESDPPLEGGFGCWSFDDGAEEAEAIALSCRRLVDAGMPAREIMVLLSNQRALWWALRDAFAFHDVPVEPPRASPFKDTELGRALFTLLRLVGEEPDYMALRTLLRLRRGVGVATAAAIADSAVAESLNYRDLFYEPLPDVFERRPRVALEGARTICAELLEWSGEDTLAERSDQITEMVEAILGHAAEEDWIDEVEGLPGEATLTEMARFLGTEKDDERAQVLVAIQARLGNEVNPEETLPERVRVMTMHSAKGLSATIVFIPGMEEEILPSARRARFPGQVLEAARMLYVSITRARLACVVSYSEQRFINGQLTMHTPSRFTANLGGTFQKRSGGLTEEQAEDAVAATAHL
ncbi:MAG TPA: ATP-dependent helicase [Solirubrobacterales bacterium]|nr:ATP-dependent helicase [Solirubrobacterales bacterium]